MKSIRFLFCAAALLLIGGVSGAADYRFELVSVGVGEAAQSGRGPEMIGEFILENTSKNPMKAFGVGEKKEGARIPASVQFQYKLKSAWRTAGSAASGLTAPTLVTLAPGERRTLRIPLGNIARLSATGRVGLRGWRGDEVLWSTPIEPQAFQLVAAR